jgi:hypothetical protein
MASQTRRIYGSMVLLNHVVQVLALTHAATTAHRPVLFQLLDCDRIAGFCPR